jgi:hypothetical protein
MRPCDHATMRLCDSRRREHVIAVAVGATPRGAIVSRRGVDGSEIGDGGGIKHADSGPEKRGVGFAGRRRRRGGDGSEGCGTWAVTHTFVTRAAMGGTRPRRCVQR